MEREVEAASGSQKELTAFLDQANNSRLRNEVCALPATCRERILFNQLDAASGMWTVAIPTARTAMTPHEVQEVAAGYFLLPSPCLAPVVGCQIILPSTEHNPVTVDLYGDALMNLPAPGDAHWRVQHDAIADAFRDHCVHDLELSLPAFNVVTGSYDPRSLKSTLLEFTTMRYGVKYTSVPRATAVDRFERSLLGDIQRGLAARDAAWHNTEPGQKGPLRDILDMSEYTGMVFGTVAAPEAPQGRVSPCLTRRPDRVAALNPLPRDVTVMPGLWRVACIRRGAARCLRLPPMVRPNAPLTPGRRRPQYIVHCIGQPGASRAAGASPAASPSSGSAPAARRHPPKAEPARGCCPAGSHVRPGGEPVVESRVRDGRSKLRGSGPARRGVAPAAAWTVADALSVAGVAAGAAWAPRIDAAARSLQPARVKHHPADVVAFVEVAAAWLAKASAVLAERHRRRWARRAGGAGQSSAPPSPVFPSVAAFRGVATPPVVAPAPPEVGAPAGHPGSQASRARYPAPPTRPYPAGDRVGWGAVDHLSDVDMVHMPAEMSMHGDGGPRAEAGGGGNKPWRGASALSRRGAWPNSCARSWDDARTETFYAGHARQRRTVDADLFAALLVGTADTVVALLRDKHPSRSHPIPNAAYDIPVDEAALTVDMRVPHQQLKQNVAAGPSGMRNEYLRCLVGEYAPASGHAAVRAMSEVASMYLQGRMPGWFNRLFASARLVAHVKKLGEGRAPDERHVAIGEAERWQRSGHWWTT
eukprot:jgi/Tetstr1/430663/TSEL_020456.t1